MISISWVNGNPPYGFQEMEAPGNRRLWFAWTEPAASPRLPPAEAGSQGQMCNFTAQREQRWTTTSAPIWELLPQLVVLVSVVSPPLSRNQPEICVFVLLTQLCPGCRSFSTLRWFPLRVEGCYPVRSTARSSNLLCFYGHKESAIQSERSPHILNKSHGPDTDPGAVVKVCLIFLGESDQLPLAVSSHTSGSCCSSCIVMTRLVFQEHPLPSLPSRPASDCRSKFV